MILKTILQITNYKSLKAILQKHEIATKPTNKEFPATTILKNKVFEAQDYSKSKNRNRN